MVSDIRISVYQRRLAVSIWFLSAFLIPFALHAASARVFTGWTEFKNFTRTTNAAGELELLSPKTKCHAADE